MARFEFRRQKDHNPQVFPRGRPRDSVRKWTRCRLWLELLEDRTLLSTVNWMGSSGNWNTPSNWSGGVLPGPSDDVVIDISGVVVTHSSASGAHTINSLAISNGTLDLTGGVLNDSTTVQVGGTFNLKGGTLGLATIVTGSTIKGTGFGGTLDGVTLNGDLDLAASNSSAIVKNSLVLNGTVSLGNTSGTVSGDLHFQGGTQTLTGSGTVLFGGSGANDLYVDGANANLTVGPGMTIHGRAGHIGASGLGSPNFINQGMINADTTAGTLYVGYSGGNAWTNQGTITGNGGSVVLDGSWTNTQVVTFTGSGNLTLQGAWTNSGTITVTSSTVTLGGSFTTADLAGFSRTGGKVNLTGTLDNTLSTLDLGALGSWYLVGGTIRAGTVATSGGAKLFTTYGTLDGVTFNGDIETTGGNTSATVINGLTLNGIASLGNVGNVGTLFFQGTQTLGGTGTVVFGTSTGNRLNLSGTNAVLTIGPGVIIRGQSGGITGANGTSFLNQGTISADTPGGTVNVGFATSWSWTNQGTIQALNGGSLNLTGVWTTNTSIQISGSGNLSLGGTWANTKPLNFSGGTLTLSGTWSNAPGNSIAVANSTLTTSGIWSNVGTIIVTNSTVNLGGSFKTSDLAGFSRFGGTVNLIGTLDNTASTLDLGILGSWTVTNGGTIKAGTVAVTGGAKLSGKNAAGTLDGITINGNLDLTDGSPTVVLNIINGLTLNGTAYLGSDGAHGGELIFQGTQTLGGSGTVIFGSFYTNRLQVNGANAVLTIGSGITIRGETGTLIGTGFVNNGTIRADVPGGIFTISPVQNWTNVGTIDGQVGTLSITAGGLTIDGSGSFSGQSTSTITISGNVGGTTTNTDRFTPRGKVSLNGPGTPSNPQILEVMGQDFGDDTKGFSHNFAYGSLALLASNVCVRLVDNADNAPGTGPEALYTTSLAVPASTTLDLNGFHVYARDAQINGIVLGGSITVVPPGSLDLNTPAPGNVASDAEIDEWTFFGRQGQVINVILGTGSGGSPPPLQPYLNFSSVKIKDPSGNILTAGTNSQSGADVSLLNITLPVDGMYKVLVQSGKPGSQGHYVFTAWDASVLSHPLPLNQTLNGLISAPFKQEYWQFTALAGTPFTFEFVSASTASIRFDLIGPNGNIFAGLSGSSELLTLPADGSYTLRAYAINAGTGSYSFQIKVTTQTELSLGSTYQGTLPGSGYAQLFSVSIPQAKQLVVTLKDPDGADHNELYVKFGSPPTRFDYQFSSTGSGPNQQMVVSMAAPGTWYFLAYGDNVPAPSTFTMLAAASGITLAKVTPDHHGNGVNAVLTLTGGVFDSTTTVSLISSAGEAYVAASVSLDLPTQLTAMFLAGTVPAGVYSVKVLRADGTFATLPDYFSVTAGGQAVLNTSAVVPANIGNATPATLYVNYSNTGDVAMPSPLLLLTALRTGGALGNQTLPGAFLTLDPSLVYQGTWTSAVPPDGFSDTIQILASGATPGLLQPGETVQVPVYYVGWKQYYGQWAGNKAVFNLSHFKSDDTRPIDWNAQKESLRPPNISVAAWDPIFTNLVAQTGTTWGAYVAMLANNAQYLGMLGERIVDVGQLWSFQVRQAIGFSTVAPLGDTVDLEVLQPGLPLSISRSFVPSFLGRYQLGVLGRGWSLAGGWLRTVHVESDGSVVITDSDGSQRLFQPKKLGGGYFSQPGDTGILTQGGGGYSLQEQNGFVTRFKNNQIDYVEDNNGNRITASYTGGRLTKLTHSSGQSLQISYNSAGRISQVTDLGGRTVVYGYDPTNEYLTSVQGANGLVTQYSYDQSADPLTKHALLSITYPGNTHQFFTYDASGRFYQVFQDGNTERVTYTYGPAGTVAAADDGGHITRVFFDYRGLVVKEEDPLQNPVYLTYDNVFNLSQITDVAGQNYLYSYDPKGNLIQSSDPLGHTVDYAYAGPFNQLSSMVDSNGNAIKYTYDAKGNLVYTTYPDNSLEQIVNDPFGNPITWTNRRGTPIQFLRDAAGRVTKVTYADGTQMDYEYSAVWGLLTSATDASGTISLTYDPQYPDRLKRITYPSGRFLEFQYDTAGRRKQMIDQDGFTVNYTYDTAGRLEKLSDGGGAFIVRYTYDPTSFDTRLSRKDLGNGTYSVYGYNASGQVSSVVNYAPGGTVNSRFDYTYDRLGRVQAMITLDGQWTYEFDGIGQLTRALFESNDPGQIPNQDLMYRYDAAGNRTQTILNGITTIYTTNNLNQYATVGSDMFGYDKDGNLISEQSGSGAEIYVYDDQNRLVEVVTEAGTWTYEYNSLGTRIATVFNGQKIEYLVDPAGLGHIVGEYDATGNVLAHYTYGWGLNSRVDALGAAAYYDFDDIGSTIGLTGPSGGYVNQYGYLPFGERQVSNEALPNPFAYIGQFGVMQEGNGLEFMRARFYSPNTGRFLSKDPIGLSGGQTNLYTYVAQNPLSFRDPLGLASDEKAPFQGSGEFWVDVGSIVCAVASLCPLTKPVKTAYQVGAVAIQCAKFGYKWARDEWWPHNYGCEECKNPNHQNNVTGKCQTWPDPKLPPGTFDGYYYFSEIPQSVDPNEKTGPAGFGSEHFVALNLAIPYRIDFENDKTATAPAQRVDVNDKLDARLDLNTFELTEIAFGEFAISVPPGVQHYQTTVSMTYNGQDFDVHVEAGIDLETGTVFVIFQSIDPITQLPPDVLTGFLPPEDGTGRGMGHVSFTIYPKSSLTTGTAIRNIALVTFDLGETVATNQVDPHDPTKGTDPNKEALITIDSLPPTSSVNALPTTSLAVFVVSWAGADDTAGSGISSYDVYCSVNGGAYFELLDQTTETMTVFAGKVGRTYRFFVVAKDNVGNLEQVPNTYDAITTVVASAPSFKVTSSAKMVQSGKSFSITVTALDANGDAITNYSGTVYFLSSDASALLPPAYPFGPGDAGSHTFNGLILSESGKQILLVTDVVTAVQGFTIVSVVKAIADLESLTAQPVIRPPAPLSPGHERSPRRLTPPVWDAADAGQAVSFALGTTAYVHQNVAASATSLSAAASAQLSFSDNTPKMGFNANEFLVNTASSSPELQAQSYSQMKRFLTRRHSSILDQERVALFDDFRFHDLV